MSVPDVVPIWVDRQCQRDWDLRWSEDLRASEEGSPQRREAFGRLCLLYRSVVANLIRSGGERRSLGDDLFQAASEKAWRSLHSFLGDAEGRRFGPWFLQTARRVLIDMHRKERQQDKLKGRQPVCGPDEPGGPDEEAAWKDLLAFLNGLVDRLPPDLRQVVRLRYCDEALTLDEIAARLHPDVEQAAGRSRVVRALEEAHRALKQPLTEGGLS
jgi:RNA polymerase sigma factor (sigma-70 family)